MTERAAVGLRRGAWTTEEDILLRNCIDKYGDGKWHLVPFRAGLNRCRKSCRLRWLNYLRPDIKRGYFTRDEVDLIIRLHKLLGNRWSLIAGRLLGRTANDIKNFWNTHFEKKSVATSAVAASTITSSRECDNRCGTKIIHTNSNNNIIKPRPRKFFCEPPAPTMSHVHQLITKAKKLQTTDEENNKKVKPSSSLAPKTKPSPTGDCLNPHNNNNKKKKKKNLEECSSSAQEKEADESIQWWKNLLEMADSGDTENPISAWGSSPD